MCLAIAYVVLELAGQGDLGVFVFVCVSKCVTGERHASQQNRAVAQCLSLQCV